MPVNMDPTKKLRRGNRCDGASGEAGPPGSDPRAVFGTETADDQEKDLADAEKKNLWDATEVIDMDTF
jgi:hypothetical protein